MLCLKINFKLFYYKRCKRFKHFSCLSLILNWKERARKLKKSKIFLFADF